jgi:hypothetical protein
MGLRARASDDRCHAAGARPGPHYYDHQSSLFSLELTVESIENLNLAGTKDIIVRILLYLPPFELRVAIEIELSL